MTKLKETKEEIHELKDILIRSIILSEEKKVDSELLQKNFKLTQFGASCVLYMMKNGKYYPELEKLYIQNILRGKNNTENIVFIEDIEPYEVYDECTSEISYEKKLSYVSTGFARWITFEEARQDYIDIAVALLRYKSPHIATIAEMIKNRNEEGLMSYFEGREKEEIIQYLTNNDFSDEDIEVVLEIVL
jgi:hypothetical protein